MNKLNTFDLAKEKEKKHKNKSFLKDKKGLMIHHFTDKKRNGNLPFVNYHNNRNC
jgi:hypothetical protein